MLHTSSMDSSCSTTMVPRPISFAAPRIPWLGGGSNNPDDPVFLCRRSAFSTWLVLCLNAGHLDLAMAMVLQYHCYLRPTEVLTLTKDHVAFPSVGRYRKWGLVISPFEIGVASKNGSFDDAVVINDIPRV